MYVTCIEGGATLKEYLPRQEGHQDETERESWSFSHVQGDTDGLGYGLNKYA